MNIIKFIKELESIVKKGVSKKLIYIDSPSFYSIYFINKDKLEYNKYFDMTTYLFKNYKIKSIKVESNREGLDMLMDTLNCEADDGYDPLLLNNFLYLKRLFKKSKIDKNLFKFELDPRPFYNEKGQCELIGILDTFYETQANVYKLYIKFDIDFY